MLKTSLGDLDIELWPKEAPRAVRNFVQLCLEGYYDGTIFHRVIKDFMVQGAPGGRGSVCVLESAAACIHWTLAQARVRPAWRVARRYGGEELQLGCDR